MLRRRDLLALTAVGALTACSRPAGGSPADVPAWPGELTVLTGGWRELPATPVSPRRAPTLTWTGTELLVTGGVGREVGPPVSCPPGALCVPPETEPLDGSGAFDPVSGTWRRLTGGNVFHHGPAWTGRLLTDGGTWFDPATDQTGRAPENGLLVYAPASWSGTEVLCVGTDGSGQPVPHTLWAWDPSTGATRTSRVPGPDSGETCHLAWAGGELLVESTLVPAGGDVTPVHAYDPQADRWRPTALAASAPGSTPLGSWDGSRLVRLRGSSQDGFPDDVRQLDLVDPQDGSSSAVEVPTALTTGGWTPQVVVGPGRVAVGLGGRFAVLDGETWTALPELPDVEATTIPTAAWAGERLVVWDDAMHRTGWSFEMA